MKIKLFYSTQATKGKFSVASNEETTWEDICAGIMDTSSWAVLKDESEKVQLPLWSLGEVRHNGGRRTNDNTKMRSGVLLDYDYDSTKADSVYMTFEDIQKDLEEFEYVMYSSVSYGRKEGYRCRVLLPFENEVLAEDFQKLYESFKRRFHYIDRSCFVLSQGQNIPAHYEEVTPYAHYNVGKLFNPHEDMEFVEPAPVITFDESLYKKCEIDDEELARVFDAVVQHNMHSLDRGKTWFFAQVMKQYGVYSYDRVALVQSIDAKTTPAQHYASTSTAQFHLRQLKNYLPEGFEFPKTEEIVHPPKPEVITQLFSTKEEVSEYDIELFLEPHQYLSDVDQDINWRKGITLMIGDCGIGKTYGWTNNKDGSAKDMQAEKVVVITPLRLIVEQNTLDFENENDVTKGIATYNQLKNFPEDKKAETLLVIDEAHGLYLDGFKGDLLRKITEEFEKFQSVVLMSGTIRPEYFSTIKFDQVIRVHKQQKFRKVIQQVRAEDLDTPLYMMAQKKIIERGTDRKMVVFVNDIKEIDAMKLGLFEKFGRNMNLITVSARREHKVLPEYKTFKETQRLESSNGLIGTVSLVEGINIIDELDGADVHIVGDLSPERIEQVTNRFRRVTGDINVFHYVHNLSNANEMFEAEAATSELVKASEMMRDAFNYFYGLMTERMKRTRLNTYGTELRCANLFWDYNKFEVSYNMIDCLMAEQRTIRSTVNYVYYRNTLSSYGFLFKNPMNMTTIEDLFEEKKAVNQAHETRRVTALTNLMTSYNALDNTWDTSNDDGETSVQRQYVMKLITKGLRYTDVQAYLERLVKDKNYWKKVSADMRDAAMGNLTSDMIHKEIHRYTFERKGVLYFSPTDRDEFALKIVEHTLETHFNGNVEEMKNNDAWRGKIDVVGDEVKLGSKSQAAKTILENYIQVGNSKNVKVNGKSAKCIELISTNRTGFEFGNLMVKTGRTSPSIESIKAKIEMIKH